MHWQKYTTKLYHENIMYFKEITTMCFLNIIIIMFITNRYVFFK